MDLIIRKETKCFVMLDVKLNIGYMQCLQFCKYLCQSCLTPWDPMDYTVHGIPQARILEWAGFLFSRGSSQPRCLTLPVDSSPSEPPGTPKEQWSGQPFPSPVDLPDPGIKPGCRALQADSLLTELPGKPGYELKPDIIYFMMKVKEEHGKAGLKLNI